MLLCCDSHIQQQHSMDVFRPTVVCTGHKWKDWKSMCCPAYSSSNTNRLWYTELHCTGILQGIFARSARLRTLRIDILLYFCWRNVHRPVSILNRCYVFGTHKTLYLAEAFYKKRDKLRKTKILCGESEGYIDLDRGKPVRI